MEETANLLGPMRVKDLMVAEFVTVTTDMPWKEAAALLCAHHVASAPVVDAEGKLVGILSEKDLFHGLFPRYQDWIAEPHGYLSFEDLEPDASDLENRTVGDVMSRRIITATPETPVLKVGALMTASGIHHVPVIEGTKLVGLVNRGSIYRAILGRTFGIEG